MAKKPLHYTELYKLSKTGKPQVYMLSIIDLAPSQIDCYALVTEKGFVDGAMQIDEEEFTEGKNLGRSNETTAKQQALVTLNSKKNKLLDKGYKEIPDGENVLEFLRKTDGTDATGNRKPMLAQDDESYIKGDGFAQRKYDGIRSFNFISIAKIIQSSKNGKLQKNLTHLIPYLKEFLRLYPGEWYMDSEIYNHKGSFQKILSSVQRSQSSTNLLGLRIYDLIPGDNLTLKQGDRMRLLRRIRRETKEMEWPLEFVQTLRVRNLAQVAKLRKKWIKEGFEGAMFRTEEGHYEFGRRSYFLIKSKEFNEDEFEIMGAEEATGRDIGTAVFLLKAKNGRWFNARPMGDRKLRKYYLINIKKLIGKMGTVKYQGLSDEGIPRFPVFKAVRNYE